MATSEIRTPLILQYPVEVDGIAVDRLAVRRPRAGDLLAVNRRTQDAEEREVLLFSWLAGVPQTAIEALDLADYRAFQALYASFTGPSKPAEGSTN